MKHLSSEMLNLWLDGQLAPRERDDARAHLATCAQCRAELAALERVRVALDALTPAPLPIDLTPRVLAQIEPTQRAYGLRALIVAEIAACLALSVWLSDTLAAMFERLPDFGAMVLTLWQTASEMLNVFSIEMPREITPIELWLLAALVVWLIVNRLLIPFPRKEVV